MVTPSINHTATPPLEPFRQMTSALPSPFTSPTPAIFQATGTPPGKPEAAIVVPSINQIAVLPVELLRQTRSALPLASRSPRAGAVLIGTNVKAVVTKKSGPVSRIAFLALVVRWIASNRMFLVNPEVTLCCPER